MDTYYGHSFESIFQSLGFLVPPIFQLMNGSGFDWYPLIIALVLVNVRGMLRHDSRFSYLNFVNHHLDHHIYQKTNYGEEWLDKMFGTLRVKNNDL
jgi:sterol desaturase/sphingolipid hydroxylase (fatty acid hydroxylase superfamily)